MRNKVLAGLLSKRASSGTLLARQICSGRCSLNQILGGRRLGTVTWRKLRGVLTVEEWDCARGFAAETLADTWLTQHWPAQEYALRPEGSRERTAMLEKAVGYVTAAPGKLALPKSAEDFSNWLEQQRETKQYAPRETSFHVEPPLPALA